MAIVTDAATETAVEDNDADVNQALLKMSMKEEPEPEPATGVGSRAVHFLNLDDSLDQDSGTSNYKLYEVTKLYAVCVTEIMLCYTQAFTASASAGRTHIMRLLHVRCAVCLYQAMILLLGQNVKGRGMREHFATYLNMIVHTTFATAALMLMTAVAIQEVSLCVNTAMHVHTR
jgi:hypothetical protein